jgi:hypothetical protein
MEERHCRPILTIQDTQRRFSQSTAGKHFSCGTKLLHHSIERTANGRAKCSTEWIGQLSPLGSCLCLCQLAGTSMLDSLLDSVFDQVPVGALESLNFHAKVLLDLTKLFPLRSGGNEGHGNADTTETSSATNTMEIGSKVRLVVLVLGNIVIDHHGDGRDIDSTGNDIGGNEDLGHAIAELIDDGIASGSLQCAGKMGNGMSIGNHPPLNFHCRVPALAEDDGGVHGQHAVELDQSLVLGLLGVAVEEELLDALDRQLFVAESNGVCIGCKDLCIVHDLVVESG